ncbi:hypothetical protein CVT25_014855 [Psilocybe cyanescens]|uniref:Exosome complex protein n=1 Tax=Psilocybe cyanescens TaxID=93625 RepID=A0A409WER3_PSICY|nr:hypothetical protein CVT25_014855 [Psilocybe cyanescens]
MNTETSKIKNRLSGLSASFDELESLLEPLFAQTLPETLVGLEPLQQAKLQTVLPYLVYDLIFIYLKSRGIDPKTHPVIPELDRIREYFEKINNAENPPASMSLEIFKNRSSQSISLTTPPSSERTEIDKAAANRFIKHAIAQAQWKKTPAETAQDADNAPISDSAASASASQRVAVKMTSKMLERAAYEKELKSRDAEADEEEDLEVFDDNENNDDISMDVDAQPTQSSAKGKGKEKDVPPSSAGSASNNTNKRRRPAIDHFAGYGDALAAPDDSPSTSAGFKKVRSSSITPPGSTPQTPAPAPIDTDAQSEKSKSTSKKSKKKAKRPAS